MPIKDAKYVESGWSRASQRCCCVQFQFPHAGRVPQYRPLHEPTTAALRPTASLLGTLTCFRDSLPPRVAGRVREADMQLSPTACHAARVVVQKNTTASAGHAFDVVSCQRVDTKKDEGLIASEMPSTLKVSCWQAYPGRARLRVCGHGHWEPGSHNLRAPACCLARWK